MKHPKSAGGGVVHRETHVAESFLQVAPCVGNARLKTRFSLLLQVIPSDNKLFNAKGLYHFRFWRFGDWVDVYIDDLLAMSDGELIYAQAATPSEIWPSLIEKAYAK